MCIIVVKPENKKLPDSVLSNMWINNPHGAGFMFVDNGVVRFSKGHMQFKKFKAAYKTAEKHKMVIHFRWRTVGRICPEQTHPFQVGESGMVHNGTIPINSKPSSGLSDTAIYAKKLAKALGKIPVTEILQDKTVRENIVNEIGRSKLVFLDGSGKVSALNAHMGLWHEDCWYSNHSYLHPALAGAYESIDYNPKLWQSSYELTEL